MRTYGINPDRPLPPLTVRLHRQILPPNAPITPIPGWELAPCPSHQSDRVEAVHVRLRLFAHCQIILARKSHHYVQGGSERMQVYLSTLCTSTHITRKRCTLIVGMNVPQGELSFERLLRVDGSFKGTLTSTGDLVIGASGVIRGNISDLREVCLFSYFFRIILKISPYCIPKELAQVAPETCVQLYQVLTRLKV